MAKIIPSDYIKGMSGKTSSHSDESFVHNKTTNSVHTRHNRGKRTAPTTEAQAKNQLSFGQMSHIASVWMKANNPKSCPPNGSEAYQNMIDLFHSQHDIPAPLQFVVSMMKKNEFFIDINTIV